ncbi:hypothetical protein Dimus_012374 [Dionaea muscipula]
MAVREWIRTDESAKDLLSRVLTERPPLLLPPLHRLPLRAGNVVEIVGPSPSAKTQILLQVAVNCILPKEWKGVCYGGLEQSVMFIDLDCRLDILRLLQLLKCRISSANGSNIDAVRNKSGHVCDEHLIEICLQRFLYIRCYDSCEFLATLKSLPIELKNARKKLGTGVGFLMIDSIGAYYWVDRASTSLPFGTNSRRTFSLQSVTETVVNEIRNVLQLHPVLVLATKATIFGDKGATNDVKRTSRKWPAQDTLVETTKGSCSENHLHREFMPSVWQSFVTHRIVVHPTSEQFSAVNYALIGEQVYVAGWLLPLLDTRDKFVVKDDGISAVP